MRPDSNIRLWAASIGLSAIVYRFLVVGGWNLAAPAEPLQLATVDVDSEHRTVPVSLLCEAEPYIVPALLTTAFGSHLRHFSVLIDFLQHLQIQNHLDV